jgi:hypothetical protein
MLVPAMQSTGTFSSSMTLSTPMCAMPRAPPPDSTRQTRGRAGEDTGTGLGARVLDSGASPAASVLGAGAAGAAARAKPALATQAAAISAPVKPCRKRRIPMMGISL